MKYIIGRIIYEDDTHIKTSYGNQIITWNKKYYKKYEVSA